ncbi:MAG: TauD/TfdA family dioxygenase [Rhodospirillales bacterium]|nr:TauD/TfdA family dioxygenase [Rhodospirillales bacterium]
MTIEIRPLNRFFGAEISGLDLANGVDDAAFADIWKIFNEFGLFVIRGQGLSVDDQVALGRRFGEVQIHVMNQYLIEGHAEIYYLSNLDANGNPNGKHPDRGTMHWHTDGSWRDRPGQATIMVAEMLPATGGETHFCCTEAAYQALDDQTKAEIANLRVVHNLAFSRLRRHGEDPMTEAQKAEAPPVTHPMVRTHPVTGRKSIFLGDHAESIEGMDYDAGRQLVDDLNARLVRPEFVYAHAYQPGDIIGWDNRRLLHISTPYDTATQRRVMRRTTVLGDVPV